MTHVMKTVIVEEQEWLTDSMMSEILKKRAGAPAEEGGLPRLQPGHRTASWDGRPAARCERALLSEQRLKRNLTPDRSITHAKLRRDPLLPSVRGVGWSASSTSTLSGD